MESICNAAENVSRRMIEAASAFDLPSYLYKPKLSIDGDHWCALYGENLQDGVAGFGKSPAEAYAAFDVEWWKKLPETPK
jgi:hypothetical protein